MDAATTPTISSYQPRLVDSYLESVLASLPAVSLIGPRACGKSTTAARFAASTVHLDSPAEAGYFQADPDAALRRFAEPVLLDEWQEVPQVLGAVKRAVDAEPRPGRFILTGSVRTEITTNSWPGTGRVIRCPVFPMTVREVLGHADRNSGLIERFYSGDVTSFSGATPALDINDYVNLAVRGGFPDAVLNRDATASALWFGNYADEITHRDAELVRQGIDSNRFAAYLDAIASLTAGVVDDATILEAVRIDRRTANAYWMVLQNLFIAQAIPAWWSSHLTRLVGTEKKYLIDSGLAAAILGLTPDAVVRDSNWIGRLLDTFVVAQIRPEAALSLQRPKLHHLRTKADRHELDLVLEFNDGAVAGIEIKATSAPDISDAKHLRWFRDELGERFRMGVIFHTGPYDFQLDDRIIAAPISSLWA